jgi:mono/diheme cytochrome c family protein
MHAASGSAAGYTLRTLSVPVRLLFTLFLLTIGLGYVTALFYLFVTDVDPHRSMGMNLVAGIAMKYSGSAGSTRLQSALRGSMADRTGPAEKQAIDRWIAGGATTEGFEQVKPIFDKNCVQCHSPASGLPVPPLTTAAEVKTVAAVDTGISLSTLARVSHVHLFGISIIFLLTGSIFALSELPAALRALIIAVPYLAIWADIGSWWVTKYEPFFAAVVIIGGGLMGLALAAQIAISLWEMWVRARARTASS